jgi:hypothetical protein
MHTTEKETNPPPVRPSGTVRSRLSRARARLRAGAPRGKAVALPRLLAGCLTAWLASAAATAPAVAAVPNETCGAALLAAPLQLHTPVTGTTVTAHNDYELSGPGCFAGVGQTPSTANGGEAVYRFVAPFDGTFSFRVTDHATANLVLYVSSACQGGPPPVTVTSCLAAANRRIPGAPAEEVHCMPLGQGEAVFVYVDEAGTGGSSFVIEVSSCRFEFEPNGVPDESILEEQAGGLTCGDVGAIDPPGDVDFWALGALVAGARVFSLIDGVSTETTDFDMRVTTATDTLEFDDLNNDVEYGVDSPNIAGSVLTGELEFLRINYHDPVVAAEPYRLHTTVQPGIASATTESEPNGTIGTADAAANNYFYGDLPGPPPSTDVDIYAFQAVAGEQIHFGLDGDPLRNNTPMNPQMALLDAVGTVLREVNDGSASSSTASGAGSLTATAPFSPAEGMVFRIPADGTYYVRVSIGNVSPTANGAGDYLLSIGRNCQASLDPFVDDDGDGFVNQDDCAPLISGTFAPPAPVTNVRFHADFVTLEWDSAQASGGPDTVHDAFRGQVEDLPVSGTDSEICILGDTDVTTVVDPEIPALGRAFYYFVRGHNECGDESYGFDSSGNKRFSEGPNSCP